MKRLLVLGLMLLPFGAANADDTKFVPYKAQSARYDVKGASAPDFQAFLTDLQQKVAAKDVEAVKGSFQPKARIYVYGLEAQHTPPTKLKKPKAVKTTSVWDEFIASVSEGDLPAANAAAKRTSDDETGLGALADMLNKPAGRSPLFGNKLCTGAEALYDRKGVAAARKATKVIDSSVRIIAADPAGTQIFTVYGEPSEKGAPIGTIKQNDIIVLDSGGDWTTIVLPNGKKGFIDGDISLDNLMRVSVCFEKTGGAWKISDIFTTQL